MIGSRSSAPGAPGSRSRASPPCSCRPPTVAVLWWYGPTAVLRRNALGLHDGMRYYEVSLAPLGEPPYCAKPGYWRAAIGEEVAFVIEPSGTLLPIEVKATGLLLHTGTVLEWLAPGVLAAPWWRVV